ncbi:MAG: hypothetical protein P8M72_07905 [Gammaproteobacteria bacterium]|nr:hypothetical protein [Gammaproteobacteria bacterium]
MKVFHQRLVRSEPTNIGHVTQFCPRLTLGNLIRMLYLHGEIDKRKDNGSRGNCFADSRDGIPIHVVT